MTLKTRDWTREEFHKELLAKRRSYHLDHKLEALLVAGKLSRTQLQMWAANRYYYQAAIPRKDAYILAACPDRDVRRRWRLRIEDQDGSAGGAQGGVEAWLGLAESTGLSREAILDGRHVLPGTRFAVDAYVEFARTRPWQESVCASLSEMFAPEAHRRRLEAFPAFYPWVPAAALRLFEQSAEEARRDADHALTLTLSHFLTRAEQGRALDILQFKLDVLWAIADAVYHAHVAA